jgi:alpha-N-arabinofuranosidase
MIHPELHGQFIEHLGTCVNDGIWVGEASPIPNIDGLRRDVVDALARLAPPLVRWPGGCFADMYHWRNGIGPRSRRPVTYNSNFGTHTLETNGFGTHEFMSLCRKIGARPWLNVNMLTGSVTEMVEWAEYCNREAQTTLTQERAVNGSPEPFDVRFWGIGNEPWAGGGFYTAESYAAEYRKYATAFPCFDKLTFGGDRTSPRPITLIAAGPDGNKPRERVEWTRRLFQAFGDFRPPRLDALDLHFYNWNIGEPADTVTEFAMPDWYRVLHGAMEIEAVIAEQYDQIQEGLANFPENRDPFALEHHCQLIMGEWGNWHQPAPDAPSALWQQVTMRDALTTAITLDIFHRNSAKLRAACVAQTVNVLNSLILTQGEHTILTPNYHVFDLFKIHRGGEILDLDLDCATLAQQVPALFSFASEKSGMIAVNLINARMDAPEKVELTFDQAVAFQSSQLLAGEKPADYNTPDHPDRIRIRSGPAPSDTDRGMAWLVTLPPASVTVCHFNLLPRL